MKLYEIKKYNSRAEWLKTGRKIGGSSAAAIINKSHWKKPIDIWASWFDESSRIEGEKTASQTYGTECEEYIRQIARLNFQDWGREIISPKKRVIEVAVRKDKSFMTATIDGTIKVKTANEHAPFNYSGKGILEIKTHDVKGSIDLANWTGSLPPEYLTQVFHYLAVYNDYNFAVLVAKLRFFSGEEWKLDHEEIRYYFIDRKSNEKQISMLEEKETEFYEQYIIGNKIPNF